MECLATDMEGGHVGITMYQWHKPFEDDTTFIVTTTPKLEWTVRSKDDQGSYSCCAANYLGCSREANSVYIWVSQGKISLLFFFLLILKGCTFIMFSRRGNMNILHCKKYLVLKRYDLKQIPST